MGRYGALRSYDFSNQEKQNILLKNEEENKQIESEFYTETELKNRFSVNHTTVAIHVYIPIYLDSKRRVRDC